MSEDHARKLHEYARLAVRGSVNVQPGQELLVSADIADRDLVRYIVTEAYQAGAKNVQVFFSDEANTLSRFKNGSEQAIDYFPAWFADGVERALKENAARLVVYGADPGLLRDIPPDKVARSSSAQARTSEGIAGLMTTMAVNWCVIGAASPAWARMVYPDLCEQEAMARLWDAIFSMSRMDHDDPTAAWTSHLDGLMARSEWLNGLGLEAVRFRGPGTDLRVGLAEGADWLGGWCTTQTGIRFAPNVPTEEVFSVPHMSKVEGTVTSTKPLSVRGQVLEGIYMEFRDGKAVKATAETGEETLRKLLDTDEGATHLGEVALVPHSSAVCATDTLYYNTLYDENAACHIALGRSYDLDGLTDDEKASRGFNHSLIHVDWMIGSSEIDVDGIRKDGTVVPILKHGEWAAI
jgi:aminopeptidase